MKKIFNSGMLLVFLFSLTNCDDMEEELDPAAEDISADFNVSRTTIVAGDTVQFFGSSDQDPDEWKWSFIGATPDSSCSQNPIIQYNEAGTYDIELIVIKGESSSTELKTDYITVIDSLIADFEMNDVIVDLNQEINLTDLSTGNPTSWSWSTTAENVTISNEQNPTISFQEPGFYDITLMVQRDIDSMISTITKTIEVMPNELIAYYAMNGNAKDETNNNYDGMLMNSPLATVGRKFDESGAFRFDGVDDYISTTTEIGSQLSNGATFSAWIYLDSLNKFQRIITNYNGEGAFGNCNERIGFNFSLRDNNELIVNYSIDADDYVGRQTAGNIFEANKWYHVVATWSGGLTADAFSIYINGIQSDRDDFNQGFITCNQYLNSELPFVIGKGFCGAGACQGFNGKIDDVKIFSKALSSDEVRNLYEE